MTDRQDMRPEATHRAGSPQRDRARRLRDET